MPLAGRLAGNEASVPIASFELAACLLLHGEVRLDVVLCGKPIDEEAREIR